MTDPIRVLMVEDQEDLRDMIGLALQDMGIAVDTTADGHEAVAMMESEPPSARRASSRPSPSRDRSSISTWARVASS